MIKVVHDHDVQDKQIRLILKSKFLRSLVEGCASQDSISIFKIVLTISNCLTAESFVSGKYLNQIN